MEHRVFKYKSLSSTNLEAEVLLETGGLSDSAFVVADYQSSGKGQGGSVWDSEAGSNLLFSWIVFPAFLSVSRQFQLSKAMSLAICDYLDNYLGDVTVKWPNDIFCGASKIGGMLIENSIIGDCLKHSIIGIGININQQSFPEFPYKATSMRIETGLAYDLELARKDLFQNLERNYQLLQSDISGEEIDEAYLGRLYKRDEPATFIDQYGEFEGIIRGVSDIGELLIQTECSVKSFGFHELKMIHFSR